MIDLAAQMFAHAVGDYVIQSDAMATRKTSSSWWTLAHVVTYGLPFLVFAPSPAALAVIVGTHFAIDRWRLAPPGERAPGLRGDHRHRQRAEHRA